MEIFTSTEIKAFEKILIENLSQDFFNIFKNINNVLHFVYLTVSFVCKNTLMYDLMSRSSGTLVMT